MADSAVVTIDRHIIDQERTFPEATGKLSNILVELGLAAKLIHREVAMAGLVDVLGKTGKTNVQGESVQKLDQFAQEVIYNVMDHGGNLCCMVSEEEEEVIPIPAEFPAGAYVLLFDPLDGSSTIDVKVSIGTIFSILRKISSSERGGRGDCLQSGRTQVAAGYVLYGSSTMLVYTSGSGVYGFTLDPSIGEFLLSHPNFHRTLMKGGIFMYPRDAASPEGKLRLLYEASPLAMVCEEAGGRASDGERNILDIVPHDLHQRTPLYLGSSEIVDLAEEFLRKDPVLPERPD